MLLFAYYYARPSPAPPRSQRATPLAGATAEAFRREVTIIIIIIMIITRKTINDMLFYDMI